MKLFFPLQKMRNYKIDTVFCDTGYQKLYKTYHSGYDINGVGGGNTDYGDPVYSVYDGIVDAARVGDGKWGMIVRIWHPDLNIYSRSAHLMEHPSTSVVKEGQKVRRGQLIGHMGNGYGAWIAHLHIDFQKKILGNTYDYWKEGLTAAAYADVHNRYIDPKALGIKFGWE